MKSVLLYILLICGASSAFSQVTSLNITFPLRANKIVYSDTILLGFDATRLFGNAGKWYQHNFETNDNTLIVNNDADHIISGSGIIHKKPKDRKAEQHDIYFTIDITTLPGMYTYSVYDIYRRDDTTKIYFSDIYNEERFPTPKPRWAASYRHYMLTYMDAAVTEMIADLKVAMKK